jgi:acylphosphatase
MKTFQLNITGKVQGVWYRASAKDEAIRLGLRGEVWNNADDSVGVIVQGDDEVIRQFVAWCKKGPPLARVEEVTMTEVHDRKLYTRFEIVRTREMN